VSRSDQRGDSLAERSRAERKAGRSGMGAAVGAGRGRNRHLVTCRTRAYQGRAQLGEGFTRANLVDFGPAEVEVFVRQWSRALRHVAPDDQGPAAAEAARYAEEPLGEIRTHPHALPLTANPLMLTILAVVHWNRRKLPEQRADLYVKAIALRMFEDPKGVRKSLGRGEAAEAVRPLLGVDLEKAHAFVEDEELHSGILVSRTEGEAEFWHPTFGEYLAAVALARKPDYWDHIHGHLFEERWNEVVLGYLAGGGGRVAVPAGLPGRARSPSRGRSSS
jgi:predicted NACHT family NTPase